MQLLWILAVVAGLLAIFFLGARTTLPGRERVANARDGQGRRDLGANVNPSQAGNEVNLWPDRTGPRTRRELGARHAVDMTFTGNREERRDLDPEDHHGDDRVVPRTTAPDQPPTQWHPANHGVPGDHYRDGHHRSATAPERKSTATDPYAHAPVRGPNHLPPEGGVDFPDDIRP